MVASLDVDTRVINLVHRCKCQFHVPPSLPPKKEPPISIEYDVGWAPELIWILRKRENIIPVPGIEPQILSYAARSLISISTVLLRLLIFICLQTTKI